MYERKAYGPHRRRSQQALARDITASILAARQHRERRSITLYTRDEDTTRLVEGLLTEAARESQLAQEGENYPTTEVEHNLF